MTNSSVVLNTTSHREDSFIQTQGPNGVKSIFPAHQSSSHSTMEVSSVISSTAVPSNILQSGGFVEWTLPKQKKKIHAIHLEVTLKNTTSGTVSLNRAFSLLDKIEYFSGSNFLGVSEQQAMYLKYALLNADSQISARAQYTNLTSSWTSWGLELEAGGSRTLYIEMGEMLSGLIPGFLNQELRLRVHFDKMMRSLTSTAANSISITNSKLLVENVALEEPELAEIESIYKSNKFTHRFFEPRVQKAPLTLTTGGSYTISLQNFYGSFSQLWVSIREAEEDFLSTYNYLNFVDNIWLTDAGNKIALGGNILKADFLRYQNGANFPSSFLGRNAVIPLVSSKSSFVDLKSGRHSGSLQLSAKGEALHIQLRSDSPISGNHIVQIVGWHASALRVQDGNIIVLR